jgi:hypothetical protein
MCEIIDFLEPDRKGARCPPLIDDNSSPEAGVVPRALASYSELLRQDLCAGLMTLNHYGLGAVGCALVDALFACVVRSRRAARAIGRSVADRRRDPENSRKTRLAFTDPFWASPGEARKQHDNAR